MPISAPPARPVPAASPMPAPRVWSSQASTSRERWRRRIFTIPVILIGFLAFVVLLIPALIVGGIVDLLARRRGSTVRLAIYAVWWAGLESAGVLWAAVLWMRYAPLRQLGNRNSLHAHSQLQRWWSTKLVWGARTFLGMAHELEGSEALQSGGPLIVLARHGSQGDALLVASVLATAGLRPRFVLKRQLLWDPCLDVVGHRIPNYFVDRNSTDNRTELDNIARLATDLENDEAIVIFPEGTRYSDAKRKQAIDILETAAPERVASARRLRHVLPIRTAGLLAILEAAPSTDLLFLNHVGVHDFRTLGDLWRNVPFPVPIQFHATRTSRYEAPTADELVGWLDARWEEFDAWVATNTPEPPGSATAS